MRKALVPLLTLTLLAACNTTAERQEQAGTAHDATAVQQNKTLAYMAIGGVT